MRLEIIHETRYTYSSPVRESVMELWLQPLTLPLQRMIGFEIVTEPRAKMATYRDWLGNIVYSLFCFPKSIVPSISQGLCGTKCILFGFLDRDKYRHQNCPNPMT